MNPLAARNFGVEEEEEEEEEEQEQEEEEEVAAPIDIVSSMGGWW